MAGTDDGHVEVREEVHASLEGGHVGVRQVVDQGAVVDDVAGIPGPGALLGQGDASRCVAGKVQHGQYPLRAVQARRHTRPPRLGGVGGPVAELGCPTDMIQVRVAEQDHRIALEHARNRLPQGDDTEPGVDHDVAIVAAQPPEVG
nr:hypothetical protein [Micromonospora sp. MA102]